MKYSFCLLLLIPYYLSAQPDIEDYKIKMIPILTESLEKSPENDSLTWERINLLFNPHFTIYTRPIVSVKDYRVYEFYHPPIGERLKIDTLIEINKLIDKNVVVKGFGSITNGKVHPDITSANFFYKRGQYFYLRNQKEEALKDYLTALNANPDQHLKERICISLAAYYYNLEKSPSQKKLLKALEYVDLVTPIQYETTPRVIEQYDGRYLDIFEREKIMLLEATNNETRLTNYLKSLALTYIRYHLEVIKRPDKVNNNIKQYSGTILSNGFDYLKMLYDYYIRIGKVGSPDNYIENLLNQLIKMETK
ncbi:MAG: hypothetical protein DHS20C18_41860 [Saprospiraceae bacterium]|nr:MAG: hypothetical protein DHS20C18_41860 [Saprospiraceae bacterium]